MLSRPSSRQIFGSCVVLPDPVAPATMTTWLSRMASAISSRIRLTGSSGGYAMLNSMLVSVYPRAVEHPGAGAGGYRREGGAGPLGARAASVVRVDDDRRDPP
ncbi:hypothetical protein BC477_03355 [Clavibacter michiganensis subsp. michiganensis]|nr:hypothetical protein BC477_03355 [Clavibacter michiganensis subsp. michiganensis]